MDDSSDYRLGVDMARFTVRHVVTVHQIVDETEYRAAIEGPVTEESVRDWERSRVGLFYLAETLSDRAGNVSEHVQSLAHEVTVARLDG
jgi:hypothetical protein